MGEQYPHSHEAGVFDLITDRPVNDRVSVGGSLMTSGVQENRKCNLLHDLHR